MNRLYKLYEIIKIKLHILLKIINFPINIRAYVDYWFIKKSTI